MHHQPDNQQSDKKVAEYKVREFEWFEVESKIRKYVQDLLQPVLKRFSEDKKLIEQNIIGIKSTNDRIDNVQDLIMNNKSKLPLLQQIDQKFDIMQAKIEAVNLKTKEKIRKQKLKNRVISQDFEKVRQEMEQMQSTKQCLDGYIQQITENFQTFQKQMEQQSQKTSQDLINHQSWMSAHIQRIDQQIEHNQFAINEIKSTLQCLEKSDQQTLVWQQLTDEKFNGQQVEIEKLQNSVLIINNNLQITKKCLSKVQDIENQGIFIENFIDKYLNLYTQSMISDSLFKCLDTNGRKKLIQYDEKVFEQLNQIVINDEGQPNLREKVKNAQLFIEQVLRRDKKYMIQHSLVQRKTTFSNESDQYNDFQQNQVDEPQIALALGSEILQQQKVNTQGSVTQRESGKEDEQQLNSPQLKNQKAPSINAEHSPKIQPEQKNLELNLNLKPCSIGSNNNDQNAPLELAQQLTQLVQDEIKVYQYEIDTKLSKIQNLIQDSDETNQFSIQKYTENIDNVQNTIKTMQTDVQLERINNDKKIQSIWTELEKIVTTFNSLSQAVHKLLHFSTLHNHLFIQDEIDKQGLALYGLKQNFNDQPPSAIDRLVQIQQSQLQQQPQIQQQQQEAKLPVHYRYSTRVSSQSQSTDLSAQNIRPIHASSVRQSIQPQNQIVQPDPSCLSCQGQSSLSMQSFKMACLAYNPSNITVEGKIYKREELLEIATKILKAARTDYQQQSKPITTFALNNNNNNNLNNNNSNFNNNNNISNFNTNNILNTNVNSISYERNHTQHNISKDAIQIISELPESNNRQILPSLERIDRPISSKRSKRSYSQSVDKNAFQPYNNQVNLNNNNKQLVTANE